MRNSRFKINTSLFPFDSPLWGLEGSRKNSLVGNGFLLTYTVWYRHILGVYLSISQFSCRGPSSFRENKESGGPSTLCMVNQWPQKPTPLPMPLIPLLDISPQVEWLYYCTVAPATSFPPLVTKQHQNRG